MAASGKPQGNPADMITSHEPTKYRISIKLHASLSKRHAVQFSPSYLQYFFKQDPVEKD